MSEPELAHEEVDISEETADGADGGRGGKRAVVAVLLLLLLLCAVTSIVDIWVNRGAERVRFVTRNLECLQCHTELIPDFDQTSVHDPFVMKQCTVCHTSHGTEVTKSVFAGGEVEFSRIRTVLEWLPLKWVLDAYDSVTGVKRTDDGGELISTVTDQVKGEDSMLTAPAQDLCWTCHGNLAASLAMDYEHNPFETGRCTSCHNPHASENRKLLAQKEEDLCVTCHPVASEMSRDQVHPPFQGRFCTNCHNPHASDYRGILVSAQRDLCFTCHPSVAPLSLKAVQHNPFLYDNCTGCHEPHGSDYRPLLISSEPSVCYRCHTEIQNDFAKASHHPVGTAELNCTGCHNPHAGDYSALLIAKDNNLCYVCHGTSIKPTYSLSAHEEILCIDCHTPHGSKFAPILRDSNPEVCLRCHVASRFDESSPSTHRNNHPVRPSHYDVNAETKLTCTSTCHNPHGTAHNFMLRYYDFPQDGNCLICHQVTPGDKVGIDF